MKITVIPNDVVLPTDNMEASNAMEFQMGCTLDELQSHKNLAFERLVKRNKERSEMTFAERIISDCRDYAVGAVFRAAYGK